MHTIPAKLFSSIACGKKAIVNSNSLASEICKKNEWGWSVDDTDVKGISKTILELNRKWGLLSDGENNDLFPFGTFENKINWDSQAEKLVDAYVELKRP